MSDVKSSAVAAAGGWLAELVGHRLAGDGRGRVRDRRQPAVARRRRVAAAGEQHGHRVRAGGVDLGVRTGVRRPLQPGRLGGRLAARPPDQATACPASGAATYSAAQIVGGDLGAVLANVMFDLPAASDLDAPTASPLGHGLGEVVATAGLVLLIFALARTGRAALSAAAVGAYIGAAYWFTSSTSFANPAVTIGRIFSDTFAGIAPASALFFIAAQLVGGLVGLGLVRFFFPDAPVTAGRGRRPASEPRP